MEAKEKNENLEKQKEELLQIAEEHLGKKYFEQLEAILSEIDTMNEEKIEYSVEINHKGAFYAN